MARHLLRRKKYNDAQGDRPMRKTLISGHLLSGPPIDLDPFLVLGTRTHFHEASFGPTLI
jgi:hypothetical protein